MDHTKRTFHDMRLFQGNSGKNAVEGSDSKHDREIETAFGENDKDHCGVSKESRFPPSRFPPSRFRRRRRKSGNPLILAPPVIESVEERSDALRTQFTMDVVDDDSGDQAESIGIEANGVENIHEHELQESPEESNNEIMLEESSSFQDEDEAANQFIALDESIGELCHFADNDELIEDFSESPESYESPGSKETPESYESPGPFESYESIESLGSSESNESFEPYESPTEPIKSPVPAHRIKNANTEMTKVRLPLHLAEVDLEIDIFDTFNLSRTVSTVSNVECSLHSIDAEVLLPSANLFTKGTLLLNIDYVSTDDTRTMHSLKIHIPWKEIIPVKWVHPPELSFKDRKEYMFTTALGMEAGVTREYSESLAEKVDFSLSTLHCVWNEQFIQNDRVMIQGTAKMKIDLFQKQCLDLQKMLSL